MNRLRTILLLRGALALFLAVLGVVLLASGTLVFGVFALVAALVNAVLIAILARRARPPRMRPPRPASGQNAESG